VIDCGASEGAEGDEIWGWGAPLSTAQKKISIFSLKIAIFGAFGLLFLQFSGPFCMQIMLIDDRPYATFQSWPKNEETVASSCLNVVTALALSKDQEFSKHSQLTGWTQVHKFMYVVQ